MLPLAARRILEVGCGRGQWLATFESFGADRDHLAGIDLDARRVGEALTRFAAADLRIGDATALPWADATFDIVFQSTMFTSILDPATRAAVAREMVRVVAPGGAIISYDFRYDNPKNPHVRRLGRADLHQLFPRCEINAVPTTLAPPIARRLVPRSWFVARALEHVPWLNTHLMAIIRPEA
jgi:ubiquinone/menaquinone biosynthesis C-methylase UbiE